MRSSAPTVDDDPGHMLRGNSLLWKGTPPCATTVHVSNFMFRNGFVFELLLIFYLSERAVALFMYRDGVDALIQK